MRADTRKLVLNTLSNFAFRALDMALMFISIPILIAYIGDDGFGIIVLVGALTGYFGILNAGMPAGTQKYVAEFHAKEDKQGLYDVINTSMGFFGIMGLMVSVAVGVFLIAGGSAIFVQPDQVYDTDSVLLVTVCLAIFTWPSTALASGLAGLQEFHKLNLING